MKNYSFLTGRAVALAFAGALAIGPALADKGGKGHGDDRRDGRDESRAQDRDHDRDHDRDRASKGHGRSGDRVVYFEDRHRVAVREYYGDQFRSGHCPPGLAKKHNGCMPPGQAKRWEIGRPLPRDVIYYEVPRPLVLQLGPAPSGYRYARVGGDILMLAIGTALVVEAIQNLGG